MIKKIKIASLAILLGITACQKNNSDSYQLVDVENFESAINTSDSIQLIDVRTAEEFEQGHIDLAKNLDWNASDFEEQINKLNKNETVYVYCLSGGRSKKATDKLLSLGFTDVVELDGGYLAWSKTHQPNSKKEQYSINEYNKMVNDAPIVLIDFYAEWCGPCKKMAPFIEQFKTDYKDQVQIIKIDVDKNMQLVTELGYEALPTTVIFNNGEKVFEEAGYIDEESLRNVLNSQL